MEIKIRKEILDDKEHIFKMVKEAFEKAEHSDGQEHCLIDKLRASENYIDELSLVALDDENIVGHIMFTKAYIDDGENKHETLALAPLAIAPEQQRKGIGGKLIELGLEKARNLGYKSAIVLGSDKYYPKFGFNEASKYGIKAPFEVPSENFMAIELDKDTLKDITGTVIYAKEFFE